MKKVLLIVVLGLLLVSFVSGSEVTPQFIHLSALIFEKCVGNIEPPESNQKDLDHLYFKQSYNRVLFGDGQKSDYEIICKYSQNETKCLECADEAILSRAIEKINEDKFQEEKQSQTTISDFFNYAIYIFILFIVVFGIYKVIKWQIKTIWRILLLIIFIMVLLFLLAIPFLRMLFTKVY